jgi:hypothetical protein
MRLTDGDHSKRWQGSLWNGPRPGRFKAIPSGRRHFLTVCRYVERNTAHRAAPDWRSQSRAALQKRSSDSRSGRFRVRRASIGSTIEGQPFKMLARGGPGQQGHRPLRASHAKTTPEWIRKRLPGYPVRCRRRLRQSSRVAWWCWLRRSGRRAHAGMARLRR